MEPLITLAILVPIVAVGSVIAFWPSIRYHWTRLKTKNLREEESAARFKAAMEALDRSRWGSSS